MYRFCTSIIEGAVQSPCVMYVNNHLLVNDHVAIVTDITAMTMRRAFKRRHHDNNKIYFTAE